MARSGATGSRKRTRSAYEGGPLPRLGRHRLDRRVEWLNVYNRGDVVLTPHDKAGFDARREKN